MVFLLSDSVTYIMKVLDYDGFTFRYYILFMFTTFTVFYTINYKDRIFGKFWIFTIDDGPRGIQLSKNIKIQNYHSSTVIAIAHNLQLFVAAAGISRVARFGTFSKLVWPVKRNCIYKTYMYNIYVLKIKQLIFLEISR